MYYTGKTYFQNITANLNTADAMGKTSLLNATNSTINLATGTTVGELNLTGSSLVLDTNAQSLTVSRDQGTGNAVIDASSSISGDERGLSVHENLVVRSQNAGFTNSTVSATNITVNHVGAFGSGTSSTASGQYVFEGASDGNAQQTNAITAGAIILKANDESQDSDVVYATDANISTQSTTIQDGSTLVANKSQLGSSVTFSNGGSTVADYNKLTIRWDSTLNGSDNTWSFGSGLTFNSGNEKYAVVVADGTGSPSESRFTISSSEASSWTDYDGWLRIASTSFELDETLDDSIFNHVGLSVGASGTVVVDDVVSIDRFGWSSEGNNNGVLDLTNVTPTQGSDGANPVLTVNELWIEGSSSIRLNPQRYLQGGSAVTDGSVLDYQDGAEDNRYQVVAATSVTGNGDITLQSTTGNTAITTDILHIDDSGVQTQTKAATGTWDYDFVVSDGTDGQQAGVYLTYALTKIDLVGGNSQEASLVLDVANAQETELRVEVSGAGIIEVRGNDNNKALTISDTDNSFSGRVDVEDGVTLTAMAGALGTGGAAVALTEGSSLVLTKTSESTVSTQTINGLSLSDGSSVTLEGVGLNLALASTDYMSGNTTTVGDGQLKGDGDLSLSSGKLTFASATTLFDSYTGALSVAQDAEMVFSDAKENSSFELVSLAGAGQAILQTDTTVLGDLSGFTGTLALDSGKSLVFDEGTNVGTSLIVEGVANSQSVVSFDAFADFSNSAIDGVMTFNNITNFTLNDVKGVFETNGDLTLTLTGNSAITRQKDTLDAASIGEGSTLAYEMTSDATGNVSLDSISGAGVLSLEFTDHEDLVISSVNEDKFTGGLRFENATFEIGVNHQGSDENATVAGNNALIVGNGSQLVMNGSQKLGQNLTLEENSTIDFTKNEGGHVVGGVHANAIDMDGNKVNVSGSGTVIVNIDPDIKVQPGNLGLGLMQSVRVEEGDSALDVTLINNIGAESAADLNTVAGALKWESATGNDPQNATVTYYENDQAIADITTGVGLASSWNSENQNGAIGLSYSEVTQVAVYDGKTAVFEATGEGDTINAQITDKEGDDGTIGGGSVHFVGAGSPSTIYLTNTSNNYSSSTTIDGEVTVVASGGSLGQTSNVKLSEKGQLQLHGDQVVGGLEVDGTGGVTIAAERTFTVEGSANNSANQIAGSLAGDGTLALTEGAVLTYVNESDQIGDNALSVAVTTDAVSTFVKEGAGMLDFAQTLKDTNIMLNNGGLVLSNGDSLGTLTIGASRSGTHVVDVQGLASIATLNGSGAIIT